MKISKHNVSRLALFVLLFAASLLLLALSVTKVKAQPPTMKKYVDDLEMCRNIRTTDADKVPVGLRQFCILANANVNGDKDTRNDLIELVVGQIDDHYRDYKNGIRKKNNFFQTILDILEVGASTTIDFIKGERPKTVIASALTGLKGGRSAFNKNFELRQLDVLINRMNTDRAEVLARIIENKNAPSDKYRWLQAKRDLRNYYEAGTWGHALDSLISTTGSEADVAEKIVEDLNNLKKAAGIQLAPTSRQYEAAISLDKLILEIESPSEVAEEKLETAKKEIDRAQTNIEAAKNETPENTAKIKEWTDKKEAAEKVKTEASAVIATNLERVKKIYDAANLDPVVKVLMAEIPNTFATLPKLAASRKNIKDGMGTVEDYISVLQKLIGIATDDLDKHSDAVVRISKMFEIK